MKKQQESGILPWALLTVPVLWAAAIMAYAYEDGMNIFDLLGRFTVLVERPFAIGWTPHTLKFMLIGLLLYGCAAALFLSTKENRRPGEEHGSARWGSPRQLCAKYRDKDPICDKKLQLEESKLVEQAKRIAKPAQGRTQSEEIGLFDEMVLGIQNYYRIATCISLDCRKIHRRVMTVLTNRLNTETGSQLVREGGAMTDSEKERFGASQMVRYVSGINRPIYPIAFIKYKTAIGISAAVCCFSPAGRKKIHDNLEMDTTLFAYLREHPPQGHSLEYADCRFSLLSAQKGKCAVSGEWFLQPDSIVCHMKVPKEQGGQERYSNLVLLHRRYLPLLIGQDAAALKSICKQLTVTRKQLAKINNLRATAKLAAI